jgi:N-glycosylase/DNA lyase
LTANSTAERCIDVQKKVNNGFLNLSETELQKKLKKYGCRFHTKRAGYISEARKFKDKLILEREWLVENIKGLGMKEASHFLRNIGYGDYAIIDFHIVDLLLKNNLIKKKFKTLTKKTYLELEGILKKIADKTKLNLAELDLYLWYMETGKVLK